MMSSSQNILGKHEDYMDWEKLIKHCGIIDELTELEKEKAKRAFRLLKKEFGDEFLEWAFTNHHPIVTYIRNLAPWTRKWITLFAQSVEELKDQGNFPDLLNRLKSKEKFEEGLSVLEVAYKFSKAGFSISFDPSINVSGKTKIPDLKLTDKDTKEVLFAEVSLLGESRTVRDAFQISQKITEPLWQSVPFVHYCGHIHKALSKRHLEYIVKKITEAVEKVKRENSFQELVFDNVIEIGMAPEHEKQLLEKWGAERELHVGEFTGPPFDVNEILRVKRKIEKEQKQLPRDNPNILAIRNNNMFFLVHDLRKAISELEEAVYDFPHLLAVVIAGRQMGGDRENVITMKDQHVYIKKTKADLLIERYIILLNRFCELKISPSTITKMYNSFRNY